MDVTAVEQVRLYGLLINPGRTVSYGGIRPAEASDIFIREGIIPGRYEQKTGYSGCSLCCAKNRDTIQGVLKLEEKLRRRDIFCGEEDVFRFYRDRIPPDIYDFKGLEHFLKEQKNGQQQIELKRDDIMLYNQDRGILSHFPSETTINGHDIQLEYVFDPQRPDDGITALIPERISRDLTTPVF